MKNIKQSSLWQVSLLKILLVLLLIISGNSVTSAYSADLVTGTVTSDEVPIDSIPCNCTTNPDENTTYKLGNIANWDGDVLYSEPFGFERAKTGAALIDGSQILVGSSSSVHIIVGKTCDIFISQNTEVKISQPLGTGNEICVNIEEEAVAMLGVGNPTSLNALAIIGGIGAIGGIYLAIGGGETSVSR